MSGSRRKRTGFGQWDADRENEHPNRERNESRGRDGRGDKSNRRDDDRNRDKGRGNRDSYRSDRRDRSRSRSRNRRGSRSPRRKSDKRDERREDRREERRTDRRNTERQGEKEYDRYDARSKTNDRHRQRERFDDRHNTKDPDAYARSYTPPASKKESPGESRKSSGREPLHRNFSKQTRPHIIDEPRTEYWDQSIPSVPQPPPHDGYAGWYSHGRNYNPHYYSQYPAHNQYYPNPYYPPGQHYYPPDGHPRTGDETRQHAQPPQPPQPQPRAEPAPAAPAKPQPPPTRQDMNVATFKEEDKRYDDRYAGDNRYESRDPTTASSHVPPLELIPEESKQSSEAEKIKPSQPPSVPVPHPPIEEEKHKEPIEIGDLDVGSVVLRRGELMRIVKVSREMDPPSFIVSGANNEVNVEADNLSKFNPRRGVRPWCMKRQPAIPDFSRKPRERERESSEAPPRSERGQYGRYPSPPRSIDARFQPSPPPESKQSHIDDYTRVQDVRSELERLFVTAQERNREIYSASDALFLQTREAQRKIHDVQQDMIKNLEKACQEALQEIDKIRNNQDKILREQMEQVAQDCQILESMKSRLISASQMSEFERNKVLKDAIELRDQVSSRKASWAPRVTPRLEIQFPRSRPNLFDGVLLGKLPSPPELETVNVTESTYEVIFRCQDPRNVKKVKVELEEGEHISQQIVDVHARGVKFEKKISRLDTLEVSITCGNEVGWGETNYKKVRISQNPSSDRRHVL